MDNYEERLELWHDYMNLLMAGLALDGESAQPWTKKKIKVYLHAKHLTTLLKERELDIDGPPKDLSTGSPNV